MSAIVTKSADVVLDEMFLELASGMRTIPSDVPCEYDGLGANCWIPTDYEFLAVDADIVYGYDDGEQRVHGRVTGVTPQRYGGSQRLRVHTEPYGELAEVSRDAILQMEQ